MWVPVPFLKSAASEQLSAAAKGMWVPLSGVCKHSGHGSFQLILHLQGGPGDTGPLWAEACEPATIHCKREGVAFPASQAPGCLPASLTMLTTFRGSRECLADNIQQSLTP